MADNRIAALSLAEKRELLKNLLNVRSGDSVDVVPLSYNQQALWFIYQLAPQSPAYNFLYAARIDADLDLTAFQHACRLLIQRHPALRTRIVLQDAKPMQVFDRDLTIDLPVHDAASWDYDHVQEFLRRRADEPFDLQSGPALRIELFRRTPTECVLLFVFHHIIADLWSMDVLLDELQEIYAGLCESRSPNLPALPAQMSDFLRWQMVSVHGPSGEKSWKHWQRVLTGVLPVLQLPIDRPRAAVQTYNGTAYTWPLKASIVQRLRTLVQELKATPFAALLAVFQLLLHRLSGQDDILVGSAVADRRRPETEHLVGYLLNQVVFRASFSNVWSFRSLVEDTRDKVLEALDHQDFPFGLLVKRLQPTRDVSRSPIFQAMFVWDKAHTLETPWSNGSGGKANGKSLPLRTLLMEQRGAPFDLTLIVFETGADLTASLRYNSDLFNARTITRFAGYVDNLLEELVGAPDRPVSEAAMLSAAERKQMLVDWNQTTRPYPNDCGFHQLFERHAAQTPDTLAVEFETQALSYRQLNCQANQMARHLLGLGIRRGDTVALSLPRGPDLIVSVLAVWKAGGAYLYLDPALPTKRRATMLSDSQAAVLIAPEAHPDLALPTVRLEHDRSAIGGRADTNLDLRIAPTDRAYVIYTSGSTGQPKGVVLHHRGLCHLAESVRLCYGLGPRDRVLQFASLSFDASVYEIALALPVGASLVLASQASVLPGQGFVQFLYDRRVMVAVLPPSVLAGCRPEPLPALHTLIVAGEACSADLVAAWAPGRRFFNAYGPTETTVWATVAECTPDGRGPTIGRPVANTRVYVLDGHMQPVPIGVTGELYVAGPGLAEGYLNQPELTAERFVPNPFDDADDAVMYRTGDLVRWTAAGELEFLGRRDDQVKIRGYRIELGEIQEVLRSHPTVADAVVTVCGEAGVPALAAYVVPNSRESFSALDVRAYLRERLPHYMLPATVMTLDALPLTVSGKVNRAALPAPSAAPAGESRPLAPPRTAAESLLVSIWSQVLNTAHVGIHDNFFDLGGASVQTLEIVALSNARGLGLTPEMLFRHQTIAELAAAFAPVESPNGANAIDEHSVPANAAAPQATATREQGAQAPLAADQAVALGGALVESIGIYLPPRTVATDEVVKRCRVKLDFPLERLSGIRSRHMGGETEFSIHLAEKAVGECLSRSAHRPEDIDLVVCCNISRCDGPNFHFTCEPTTAARIRQRFGLVNAVAFDVTNACAGTFTGLMIVDALLRHGVINRALVVSGEYITHLTTTAQGQITDYMDSRLACLTLGDSGLALTIERAPTAAVGFHDIDMYTLGKYYDLCIAKLTTELPGGAIMETDPVKASAVSVRQVVRHALERLRHHGWPLETIDTLVMHQTSETTLDGAVKEINRAAGQTVCHRGNTIYNVAERGNTATTTHFLAMWERMLAGEIQRGDRIVFGISGSGQTVGTALYTVDDLPARVRQPAHAVPRPPLDGSSSVRYFPCARPVRIESIGTCPSSTKPADTVTMLCAAGEACLEHSVRPRDDIDLILHTGVYRTEFLSEPALASIAAGKLKINYDEDHATTQRTLAFDLMDGAAGALIGCFVASQFIAARKYARTLLLASEIENNARTWPENRLGLKETASALILEDGGPDGFIAFGFGLFPEHCDAIGSYASAHGQVPGLFHHRDATLPTIMPQCIRATVAAFLARHGTSLADVALLMPPQRGRRFCESVADTLRIHVDRLLVVDDDGDYFTSSLAYSLAQARRDGRLPPGSLALIVEVAAGIQVSCALYRS
jgi:amino acid adenylation domain-containing protein